MRTTISAFVCLASLLSAALLAADDDKPKAIQPAEVKLGRPVDFDKDVAPILKAKCAACHSSAVKESGFTVDDAKAILKGGDRGPAVESKQPDKSLFYKLISRGEEPEMPPLPNKVDATALSAKEVGIIRQWILEGAKAGVGAKRSAVAWTPLPSGLNSIYSVALSPWAQYAAAGRSNQITVYNLVTGEEVARLTDPALNSVQYEGKPMYPGGAAHRDFVHSLAFSPDSNLLASGGFRVVKLWKRTPAATRHTFNANAEVACVTVSSDGKRAALGAADNTIQLVDLATGKPEKSLKGHEAVVRGVAFSADGSKLVSGSADKTVRIWDVAKGESIRTISTNAAVNDVTFNKDAAQIVSAHADNVLRVWNTAPPKTDPKPEAKPGDPKAEPAEEKPVHEMKGHSKPVTAVALLLPAGNQVVSGSEDGTVRLWNLSNGGAARTMNHGGPVADVAARPDGEAVASAGSNGVGKLWKVSNGQQLGELKGRAEQIELLASRIEREAVAKQQAANRKNDFQAAEKNVKDREDGLKKAKEDKDKADKEFAEAEKKAKPLNEAVAKAKEELAKKKDDKDLQKKVADAEKAATKPNEDLEKAKNNRDSADRAVKLAETSIERAKTQLTDAKSAQDAADARAKQAEAELKATRDEAGKPSPPMKSVAFSADGKTLATGSDDGTVHLWGGDDGRPLESIAAHKSAVAALACVDGAVLTGSADKTAALRSLQPAWELVARLGSDDKSPLDLSNSPFANRVLALDFSRDGKLLATGGGEPSRGGELLVWDVEKRAVQREFPEAHSDTVLGVRFNWDASQLATGSTDKFAKIFEVGTGKLVRSFEGHTHHVLDVAWQADDSQIVTAGADNAIKIWNAETGEQRRTVGGYDKEITAVQFIGTSANFVACSGNKVVGFHRTSNGQRYRSFGGSGDFVYAAAAGRDAAAVVKDANSEAGVVIAGGEDGVLRVWEGLRAQNIKTFEPPKPPADKTQASAK